MRSLWCLISRKVRVIALIAEFHKLMVLSDLHQVERRFPSASFEQGYSSTENYGCDMNDKLVN